MRLSCWKLVRVITMLGKWPEIPYKSVWSIAIFDIAWRKLLVSLHSPDWQNDEVEIWQLLVNGCVYARKRSFLLTWYSWGAFKWKKRDSGNIALVKEENVLCKEWGDDCERIFSSNEHFELLYFLGLLLNYICVVGIGPIAFLFHPKYELEPWHKTWENLTTSILWK